MKIVWPNTWIPARPLTYSYITILAMVAPGMTNSHTMRNIPCRYYMAARCTQYSSNQSIPYNWKQVFISIALNFPIAFTIYVYFVEHHVSLMFLAYRDRKAGTLWESYKSTCVGIINFILALLLRCPMSAMASQIVGNSTVCSTVYSG